MFLRLFQPSALEQIEAVKATIDRKGRSHQISGFALRAPLRPGQCTGLARAPSAISPADDARSRVTRPSDQTGLVGRKAVDEDLA